MAIQQTGSATPRLASLALVAIAQRSVSDFLSSQAELNSTDGNTPAQARANAFLRSRLAVLTTQSSVDQVQAAQLDVARSALEEVDAELNNLATLIGSIVGASGTALEQAQVDSVVSAIQATLGSAINANPNLLIPVALPAQIANLRVEDIVVEKLTTDIDSEGRAFSLNISTTGRQARIDNALTPGGATFTNDVSFIVTGPKGSSGVINLTGGVSSRDDAINAINAFTDSTGVSAEAQGANVRLRAVEYGVNTITILDVSAGGDPAAEVASTNQNVAGTNAAGTLTDSTTGVVTNLTGDGRSLRFSLGGVEGTIELLKSSLLADNANPGAATFTVYNGGTPILGEDGTVVGRQAIPGFDFGRLGRSLGGLASVDVINDLGNALSIVTQAQEDLSESLTVAEFLADVFLPSRINTAADGIDGANSGLAEVDNFFDAIRLFDRVQAEAKTNGALSILSQLSSIFPSSTLGLI